MNKTKILLSAVMFLSIAGIALAEESNSDQIAQVIVETVNGGVKANRHNPETVMSECFARRINRCFQMFCQRRADVVAGGEYQADQ